VLVKPGGGGASFKNFWESLIFKERAVSILDSTALKTESADSSETLVTTCWYGSVRLPQQELSELIPF
jgi:hypothetical protein